MACNRVNQSCPPEATRAFLESLPYPVAPGVRYPVLSPEERQVVEGDSRNLDRDFAGLLEGFTHFGRHRRAILAVQKAIREGQITTPVRALIVGAGFHDPTGYRPSQEERLPITVLEWGGMMAALGIEFEIDVVDRNPQVAAFFDGLQSREDLVFVVGDTLLSTAMVSDVSPLYAPDIFGPLAQNITDDPDARLPRGATKAHRITLPAEVLRRIHFFRGSVLNPLPRTGYNLVDYQNVRAHLPDFVKRGRMVGREAIDIRNLLLNAADGAWFNTDVFYTELGLGEGPTWEVFKYRGGGVRTPYLEKQADGSWRLVHPSGNSDNGPDGSGGVNYRSSEGGTVRRDGGSELLGAGSALLVYPGETVFEGTPRVGAGLKPAPPLTRLPARPLILP
ncbi:MAG: hypothetical protein Q7S98_05375 [Deltaproteobacteria bacterium]|nr:hypothetical protein [Deltaproteobacteria bacterium]